MKKEYFEEGVALAKKFIAIKSIEGNDAELETVLDIALQKLGDFTIEHFEKDFVKSVLVYSGKKRPENFKILFNLHLDVIPGRSDQYTPHVKDGRLYGVGSMDMKANAAMVIILFKYIAKQLAYPIALQLVTDEEIGGFNGTKYQVEEGVSAEMVIATEPTNFDIVYKAKGILWLRINTKGLTAHSAYPWRGRNAIEVMNSLIQGVYKEYPNPKDEQWVTTVNISSIQTDNSVFNKIPNTCVAEFDIRYIKEDKDILLQKIRELLPQDAILEVVAEEHAMLSDVKGKYIRLLNEQILSKGHVKSILRGANGSSDARHFAHSCDQTIEFGPIGGNIGADDEWVDLQSLEEYYDILESFLKKIR